jgi:hypothetical protein
MPAMFSINKFITHVVAFQATRTCYTCSLMTEKTPRIVSVNEVGTGVTNSENLENEYIINEG